MRTILSAHAGAVGWKPLFGGTPVEVANEHTKGEPQPSIISSPTNFNNHQSSRLLDQRFVNVIERFALRTVVELPIERVPQFGVEAGA
jgi:hypothetical protein